MSKRLKASLPIGIAILIIVIVCISSYWLGYLTGSHSFLPPINQDMSLCNPAYLSGKQLGVKNGATVNYNYWYQKGRQEQVDFMINNTSGGINWVK